MRSAASGLNMRRKAAIYIGGKTKREVEKGMAEERGSKRWVER